MPGGNAGNTDTGRLDGKDLIDRFPCKAAPELRAYLIQKLNVHLMVQKAVYLQYVSFLYNSVFYDAFFQKIHPLFSSSVVLSLPSNTTNTLLSI